MRKYIRPNGQPTNAHDRLRAVFVASCGFWDDDAFAVMSGTCPFCGASGRVECVSDFEHGLLAKAETMPGWALWWATTNGKCYAAGGRYAAYRKYRETIHGDPLATPAVAVEERCGTCKFFRINPLVDQANNFEGAGSCRRLPPVWVGSDPEATKEAPGASSALHWLNWEQPPVEDSGWCGEYQPKKGGAT